MSDEGGKLHALIYHLPDRYKADMALNEQGFSGSTMTMVQSSYLMVDNLKHMWVDLITTAYPPPAIFSIAPSEWINSYTELHTSLFRTFNEPDGPGQDGTIVGPETGGDMMGELEKLVARTVKRLLWTPEKPTEYDQWESSWKAAGAQA